MTILVTGASGFLGGALVNALTRANKKVRILVRKASNLSSLELSKIEQVVTGDITDRNTLCGLMDGIEVVYHCAAKLGLGRKDEFFSTNVNGTENLLQEAVRSNVSRFVYVSSVAVMSEYHDHLGSNEDNPYASCWTEPYTPSKIEAEKLALEYGGNGDLKVSVIRPGWIWGPGDVNTLKIGRAIMSGLMPHIGEGDNILSLTYITNIVHALILAGNAAHCVKDIFLINDGYKVTQKQLLRAFANRLNPDARYFSVPFPLSYYLAHIYEVINRSIFWKLPNTISRHSTCVAAKNFMFDLTKAKRVLGYSPPISFDMAVDESVRWIYDLHLDKSSVWRKLNPKRVLPLASGQTSIAHFAISSWCNARCVFCSYPDSNKRITVDIIDAIKAINALKHLGVGIISLTGGEPFLNKDIFRIAYHANSVGILVFTGTNGSMMTEDDTFKLQKAGVRAVWISYEGPTDKVFDRNRGVPGLSEKIRKDLKWLRNAGVDAFAICVINKSITDYRQFVDHLIDVGFDKIKFDYPMTTLESGYLGFKDLELMQYSPVEMEDAIRQILELKRSNYRNFGIINPTSGLEGAIDFYKGHKTRFGCTAGYRIFYIDWNLDLYRCTRLPEKFGKVWDVSPEMLRQIECNKCYYQGTRDYDSVYHLLDSIKSAGALASQGDILGSVYSVINKNNLSGLRSVLEIASS
jgi:nucleoside-diphosphate-sugar epimerase/MoaA/NifB/PqqE/SkfB family radical SAM enzyme